MKTIEKLKNLPCMKYGNISMYKEMNTIVIEVLTDRGGYFADCFIEVLLSPIWLDIDSKEKIKLRSFMIERDDLSLMGSMECAKFMMDKFGYDCIKQCSVVIKRTICKENDDSVQSFCFDGMASATMFD